MGIFDPDGLWITVWTISKQVTVETAEKDASIRYQHPGRVNNLVLTQPHRRLSGRLKIGVAWRARFHYEPNRACEHGRCGK